MEISLLLWLIPLPLVYWCVNEKKGLLLGIVILISLWINISVKFLMEQPGQIWLFRFFFNESERVIGAAADNAARGPSLIAQNTLVTLFIIASWFGKKIFYISAALLSVLIAAAVILLGRQSCVDAAAGWICGGIILCGYFLLSGRIESLVSAGGFRAGIICGASVSFIMILFPPAKEAIMTSGLLLGMILGYSLNNRFVKFNSADLRENAGARKFLVLAARFILGTAILVLMLYRVEKIIPVISQRQNIKLYSFLCYLLISLWVYVAAPWVFIKLRLAGSPAEDQ